MRLRSLSAWLLVCCTAVDLDVSVCIEALARGLEASRTWSLVEPHVALAWFARAATGATTGETACRVRAEAALATELLVARQPALAALAARRSLALGAAAEGALLDQLAAAIDACDVSEARGGGGGAVAVRSPAHGAAFDWDASVAPVVDVALVVGGAVGDVALRVCTHLDDFHLVSCSPHATLRGLVLGETRGRVSKGFFFFS